MQKLYEERSGRAARGEQVINSNLVDLFAKKDGRVTEVYEVKTGVGTPDAIHRDLFADILRSRKGKAFECHEFAANARRGIAPPGHPSKIRTALQACQKCQPVANWPGRGASMMATLLKGNGLSISRLKAARLAAANKRALVKSSGHRPSLWEHVKFVWCWLASGFNWLKSCAIFILGAVAFIVIGTLMWQEITRNIIAVAPISVPKSLESNGYTAVVAAHRLRGALNKIIMDLQSMTSEPDVDTQDDLPEIVVPVTGLSLDALADSFRAFLGRNSRINLAGDITLADSKLWLHLRLNGKDFYASVAGVELERADDLYAKAAQAVLLETNPYILAASLSESDPIKSLEIAKWIITVRPEQDPNQPLAHNLIGEILREGHKFDAAIAEYRKARDLAPGDELYHYNLGLALSAQKNTKDAIAEYRNAIRLDSSDADAHVGLGNALREQGKTDEAIAECQTALKLDFSNADAHRALRLALEQQGQRATAQAELDIANALEHAPIP